ncbi:MAG: acylphosphatase [Calothrix sp. FI2-JRJ7]|jgi:acylphosphatase|nr:acylphosphatase [Calothrix sp. FI2-JRJ7]
MSNSSSPTDIICAHIYISGRVQGVGYRYSTVETATQLGLNGWVRNLPDKRVEAVFEGKREIVEQMIRWCHEGPPAALVETVKVEYLAPEGFQGFEVRRF